MEGVFSIHMCVFLSQVKKRNLKCVNVDSVKFYSYIFAVHMHKSNCNQCVDEVHNSAAPVRELEQQVLVQ